MICWHKWGKWSDPQDKTFVWISGDMRVEPKEYNRKAQTRTCKRCNKVKVRILG